MKKVYWIATYKEIKDIKKLKQYSEKVTPIFKNFGATPVVRGGEYKALEGDNFIRTVIWEFPNFENAINCHDSKEYQEGWDLAKHTTIRNLQIVEGFNIE